MYNSKVVANALISITAGQKVMIFMKMYLPNTYILSMHSIIIDRDKICVVNNLLFKTNESYFGR